MNIISWNVRGLGRPAKRFLVKDFLEIHCSDVCCIQESKLAEINTATWRPTGGIRLDQFCYVLTIGSSGGMIISSLLSGKVTHVGTFCLSAEFSNKLDHSVWVCTTVYRPNSRHLKHVFWDEIRRCQLHLPWVICGDFNAIFILEDKNSGVPNLADISYAQTLVSDLNLVEPPLVGRKFTWTNGQANPSWIRLDRFLVNLNWLVQFPRVHQVSLPRL